MAKPLLKGAIFGGIVLFVWGFISHAVLPWHEATWNRFADEDAVAQVLTENAPRSGIYLYPMGPKPEGSEEQKQAAEAEMWEKMRKGPFAFVAYTDHGTTSMVRPFVVQLLTQILGALLATWLLLQTSALSYAGKVTFLAVVALTAGVLCHVPNWNWWGFATGYTVVNLVDLVIGWVLAGLVIAKVAKP